MSTIPDDIAIHYIAPNGTDTDITTSVLYSDAYFESQAAAIPGSFHITIKDPDQTWSFVSGGRIELTLGTTKLFGGFVTVPTRDFFFPADDTSKPIKTRRWSLDGVDYNILFDKRVLRNPSDYTHFIPAVPVGANCNDHYIISLFDDYFDLDFSGGGMIDIVSEVRTDTGNDFIHGWTWPEQGSTMRQTLDALVIQTTVYGASACIFWMTAGAEITWLALHDTIAPWGFSDVPDGTNFIGWREGSVAEDGSSVVNEVFVWGGSPIGTKGTVVLAHKFNTDSITAHGRWQMAEPHPGEDLFRSQAQVDARANALISGVTSGTSPVTGAQGLVNPDMQYNLTWFGHDVPISGGVRQHLVPGMVTTFNLWSFSEDGGISPYAVDLPMRQMRITFPTLPADNPDNEPITYTQFQGSFGLQMSDPVWWWDFLRKTQPRAQAQPIVSTDNDSEYYPYGSYFQDSPIEEPDGSRQTFSIPTAYIEKTLQIYINGVGTSAFIESSPADGTFYLYSAPATGAAMVILCRTG